MLFTMRAPLGVRTGQGELGSRVRHVIGFRDSIPKLVGSCVGQCEFGFRVRHVV
jgi:hypothetical protein